MGAGGAAAGGSRRGAYFRMMPMRDAHTRHWREPLP
jgi:hypothetical protein